MLLSKSGNTTSACVRKRHVGKKVSDTKRRNGPWDASHFVRLTSFSLPTPDSSLDRALGITRHHDSMTEEGLPQ